MISYTPQSNTSSSIRFQVLQVLSVSVSRLRMAYHSSLQANLLILVLNRWDINTNISFLGICMQEKQA